MYVYFFIKCIVSWSENSVRFENLMGIGFQMGQILWDFISKVWDMACLCMIFLWSRHCRDMTEKLLKATLNPNKQQQQKFLFHTEATSDHNFLLYPRKLCLWGGILFSRFPSIRPGEH